MVFNTCPGVLVSIRKLFVGHLDLLQRGLWSWCCWLLPLGYSFNVEDSLVNVLVMPLDGGSLGRGEIGVTPRANDSSFSVDVHEVVLVVLHLGCRRCCRSKSQVCNN